MSDTEDLLVRELERRADGVPVGPAPVAAMVRQAGVRRSRPALVALAAAAVAAVVVGVAVLVPSSERSSAPPAAPSPSPTAAADPTNPEPPPGTRYVGHGRVVVAVPLGWGTNALHCGEPTRDTVVVGNPVIEACLGPRTEGAESVEVLVGRQRYDRFPIINYAPEELVLDGVPAFRSPAVCDGEPVVCAVSLEVPSEKVQLVIESSTSKRAVEDLVAAVRVLPEALTKRVGIGHLSIEVPMSWAHDARDACGTPVRDTVLDRTGARACASVRESGIEVVQVVTEQPPSDDAARVDLDGVEALRGPTGCDLSMDGLCEAALWVPSQGVGLVVTSTTGPASVDALLDTASIDPGLAAVPTPYRLGSGVPLSLAAYEEAMADAGLTIDRKASRDPAAPVGAVSPDPGTMLPVGSPVQVLLAGS